jgi:hypothetical protein
MFDDAGNHVGDGFDTPVRMPGKSGDIVFGIVGMKIIEE